MEEVLTALVEKREKTSLDSLSPSDALQVCFHNPVIIDQSRRIAGSLVHQEADILDALQDAYMAALKSVGSFEKREGISFETWFYTKVKYAALRIRRQQQGRTRKEENALLLSQGEEDPALSVERDDQHVKREESVRNAVGHLAESRRRVIELFYFKGQSHAEIARELGIKAASVKMMLHRVRAALRAELQGLAA